MIVDHITIENFQCFATPIRLTLGPLTFLYGPNSSGKSAISDAMKLIQEVISGSSNAANASVRRWSRRVGDSNAARLPIRLVLEGRDEWEEGMSEFSDYIGGLDPGQRTQRTRIVSEPYDERSYFVYTIKMAVELREGIQDFFNPVSALDLYVDGNHLIEYRYRYKEESTDDHSLKIRPLGPLAEYLAEFVEDTVGESLIAGIGEDVALSGGHNFFTQIEDARLQEAINKCMRELLQGIEPLTSQAPLGFQTVSGDRVIPSPLRCKVRVPEMPAQEVDHDWVIGLLARLFVDSYSRHVGDADKSMPERDDVTPDRVAMVVAVMRESAIQNGKRLIAQFNNALSDLFKSNGYQIVFDVDEIRQVARSSRSLPDTERVARAWNVRVYLIDAHGNNLEIEDVGSGIGYVLPILLALGGSCSFMHQPELHLHPAMQAKLADLFVERVSSDDQARHILETHSEYLLLRVLRRIRETHMGRLDRSERKITPDEVMIYYFDPQLDGTTEVTEIPVNEFGDFLKPWPKGFFEERGKDLFDE